MSDLQHFEGLARPWFPVDAGRHQVQLVGFSLHDDGGVLATLRLVTYDGEDRAGVECIKEQQVFFLAERHHDDPRVAAALEGWASALGDACEQAPDGGDRLEQCMPHDLWFLSALLDLSRPHEAVDFHDACLRKSRLGWLLEPSALPF